MHSTGEFQPLQLTARAVFGAEDEQLASCPPFGNLVLDDNRFLSLT